MRIGVVVETAQREARVALAPVSVARFVRAGIDVLIQSEAGGRAFFGDEALQGGGGGDRAGCGCRLCRC